MASLRLPLIALLALTGLPATSAHAQSMPVRDKNVEARLVASVSTIQPGVPFTLGLQFTIDRTWHTYWANPGDTGIPTSLNLTPPKGSRPVRSSFPCRKNSSPTTASG